MNINKHWKKIVLSCAAAFWAGCGEDSTSSTQAPVAESPLSSAAEANLSSSDEAPSPMSSETTPDPTSSESAQSSSSSVISIPIIQKIYKRANDTTVTCTETISQGYIYAGSTSSKPTCDELKESLENDILSVEEINKKEEDLASCLGEIFSPVYGVEMPMSVTKATYTCSDGEILYGAYGGNSTVVNGLLYTHEEYDAAFPQSSSSAESSSSIESSSSVENPGCNKTDFVDKEKLVKEIIEENEDQINAIINSEETSEAQKEKLKYCLNRSTEDFMENKRGYIAKTQKCPDGTTSENETYTKIVEQLNERVKSENTKCIDRFIDKE